MSVLICKGLCKKTGKNPHFDQTPERDSRELTEKKKNQKKTYLQQQK